MLDDFTSLYDLQCCDETHATINFWTNCVLFISKVSMLDAHALSHTFFIKLFVVVDPSDIFRLSLTFEIKEWRIVIWQALIVLDIAKDVEEVFVVVFSILYHVGRIILQVAVGAALARLVGLILLSSHVHHIFDSLFNDCVFDILDAENELKQIA